VADTPLRPGADPQWAQILRAANLERPQLERVVFAYLLVLAGNIRQARRMLDWMDTERAIEALRLDQLAGLATAVEPFLARTAERGLNLALQAPPAAPAVPGSLVVQLDRNEGLVESAREWARRSAAALVRDVSRETRWAVRRIIEQGVHAGARPADTAKLLEDIVGLTNRQAQAVRTYWLNLAELPDARRALLTSRYADRLMRQRARMIARTETIRAANEGRRSLWRRDVADGVILPSRWEREWVAIVPSDGRTCPRCVGLDGARAPIEGEYPAPGGLGPPQHPDCRCTEVLRRTAA
jgi:hypothetical protein